MVRQLGNKTKGQMWWYLNGDHNICSSKEHGAGKTRDSYAIK